MIRIALLAALLASGPAHAAASDAEIAAVALPEPQFRQLLAGVLFSTQTMAMAAYNLGIAGNCAVVRPQFDATIVRNLPAWQANLVKSYRDNIPPETLDKAAQAGPVDGGLLIAPFMDKIGAQMRTLSTPLLKTAASEVLEPVWTAAAKVDAKTIDGPKRLTELRAAKGDGSLFCKLLPSSGSAPRP